MWSRAGALVSKTRHARRGLVVCRSGLRGALASVYGSSPRDAQVRAIGNGKTFAGSGGAPFGGIPARGRIRAAPATCANPGSRGLQTSRKHGQQVETAVESIHSGTEDRQYSLETAKGGEPATRLQPEALYGPRPEWWWTGLSPENTPGMWPDGSMSSLPQLNTGNCSKQALLDYFDNGWTLTEVLYSALQGADAFTAPPKHGLRHPLIFYYGHSAALYVNKLLVAGLIQEPVNAHYESLFETGVDEMSWDDLSVGGMDWPPMADVHAYRRTVYGLVRDVIESTPEHELENITPDSKYWALALSMEHERIHIETSSVLIREMPLSLLSEPAYWPRVHPSVPSGDQPSPLRGREYPLNPMVPVEGGAVELGKPRSFPSFGWDNEYGYREYRVPGFRASHSPISNGEYLEFVRDSGYARRELWTEEGWGWRAFRNVKCPHFWVPRGPSGLHEYSLRTMFHEVPMPWDWPAIVCQHEAKAFANWKTLQAERENTPQDMEGEGEGESPHKYKYRLMTELEHHLMRDHLDSQGSPPVDGHGHDVQDAVLSTGGRMSDDSGCNMNLSWGSETPVHSFPANGKGFRDVTGNVWQWCEDCFSALPGFDIHRVYEDFSTPCFDGEHVVIMGGSFASTGNEASRFARFHFRPHFHQHAGFRLVAPLDPAQADAFLTSCTDAPPPHVGTYPFRQSSSQGHLTHGGSGGGGGGGGSGALLRNKDEAARVLVQDTLAAQYGYGGYSYSDSYSAADASSHSPLLGSNALSLLLEEGARFPQRCAQLLLRMLEGAAAQGAEDGARGLRVLDVGCGAGAASFELAQGSVERVVAVDASKALMDCAASLQARVQRLSANDESLTSLSANEESLTSLSGNDGSPEAAIAARLGSEAALDVSRVFFRQCDPMCLPPEMTDFDAVLLHDVIDAVPSPRGLLGRMGGARGVVRSAGGLAVIVSLYDWDEVVTPRGAWLGGTEDSSGRKEDNIQGLADALGPEFELVHQEEVPRVKLQGHDSTTSGQRNGRKLPLVFTLAQATVWRRK